MLWNNSYYGNATEAMDISSGRKDRYRSWAEGDALYQETAGAQLDSIVEGMVSMVETLSVRMLDEVNQRVKDSLVKKLYEIFCLQMEEVSSFPHVVHMGVFNSLSYCHMMGRTDDLEISAFSGSLPVMQELEEEKRRCFGEFVFHK